MSTNILTKKQMNALTFGRHVALSVPRDPTLEADAGAEAAGQAFVDACGTVVDGFRRVRAVILRSAVADGEDKAAITVSMGGVFYDDVDTNEVPLATLRFDTAPQDAGQTVEVSFSDAYPGMTEAVRGHAKWKRVEDKSLPVSHSARVTFAKLRHV